MNDTKKTYRIIFWMLLIFIVPFSMTANAVLKGGCEVNPVTTKGWFTQNPIFAKPGDIVGFFEVSVQVLSCASNAGGGEIYFNPVPIYGSGSGYCAVGQSKSFSAGMYFEGNRQCSQYVAGKLVGAKVLDMLPQPGVQSAKITIFKATDGVDMGSGGRFIEWYRGGQTQDILFAERTVGVWTTIPIGSWPRVDFLVSNCIITSAPVQVDFGRFSLADLDSGIIRRNFHVGYYGCGSMADAQQYHQSASIEFQSSRITADGRGVLMNSDCDKCAKGIVVKLWNNGRSINLNTPFELSSDPFPLFNGDTVVYNFSATVERDGVGRPISAGSIDTQLILNVRVD